MTANIVQFAPAREKAAMRSPALDAATLAGEPGKSKSGSKTPGPIKTILRRTRAGPTKPPTIRSSSQTRRQSLIEALVGTAIGFLVALAAQILITRLYDIHSTIQQDIGITVFFTGISIIRSYLLRRFFVQVYGK